ncbi:MOSC domain-containing protein [Plastorhodobacter daqingensis]|uniref:MOSC domain-containing protein n=1 Tax=Plastorhodobacter daqingensis TaxID=1387281 RepID=A0ABW2UFV9_9RHOB
MTGLLAHICRHPVKSIGYEELEGALLEQGRALPHDRHWAIAHEAAETIEGWAPKMNFVRGVAGPELMAIRAQLSRGHLTLHHPRQGDITLCPDTEGARLIDWIRPLWPEGRPAPARVVHVPGQALSDVPEPYVAVLNLASNRALSARMGQDLSIHRWRGNLWLEGLEPWQEFDLIGQRLKLGEAVLRIVRPITRCKATMANPETGAVDADTLGALRAGYGHQDFGTYALVEQGGSISLGDRVEVL